MNQANEEISERVALEGIRQRLEEVEEFSSGNSVEIGWLRNSVEAWGGVINECVSRLDVIEEQNEIVPLVTAGTRTLTVSDDEVDAAITNMNLVQPGNVPSEAFKNGMKNALEQFLKDRI